MPNIGALLLVAAGVATCSWFAIVGIRTIAVRWNALAFARGRGARVTPLPLGGGIELVVVNVAAWGMLGLLQREITLAQAAFFIIGALLVAAVGLAGDLRPIPFPVRFAVHVVAALIVAEGFVRWSSLDLPFLGTVGLGGLGIAVTVLWMVGLTNAFILTDELDGLAAGQGVAAGAGWIMLGSITHLPLLVAMGILLGASSAGFLVRGWQPAGLFLGEVGSAFLGFSFAVLPVIAARSDPRLALAGVLLVWPALFDAGFTIITRLRSGENVFAGPRSFLFDRLREAGWSRSAAAVLYIPLPIVLAMLAFTWDSGTLALHEAIVGLLALVCIALWLLVRRQEKRLQLEIAGVPAEDDDQRISAGR